MKSDDTTGPDVTESGADAVFVVGGMLSAQQELQHLGREMRAAMGEPMEPSASRRMVINPRPAGLFGFAVDLASETSAGTRPSKSRY